MEIPVTDQAPTKKITVSEIKAAVADALGQEVDLMSGKSRKRPIVDARHLAMFLCKGYTELSLSAIGRMFGDRDHSTVIHACNAVSNRLDTDPHFGHEVAALERRFAKNGYQKQVRA